MEFYFYGLELHPVTFFILLVESMMLYSHTIFFISRPQGEQKYWQLIFLILLMLITAKQLFLPGFYAKFQVPVPLKFFLDRGFGYVLASYFPLYLFKMLNFRSLKWHGRYGGLCILVPVAIVFVITYSIYQNMFYSRVYMLILPAFYLLILKYDALISIIRSYQKSKNKKKLKEQLLIVFNMAPWIIVPFISVFLHSPRWVCDIFLNVPFIVSSWLFDKWLNESYLEAEKERKRLKKLYFEEKVENIATLKIDDEIKRYFIDLLQTATNTQYDYPDDSFDKACRLFAFTEMEKKVMKQLVRGNVDYKTIARVIGRSQRTIEKHAEKMRKKADVTTKEELIEKFNISLN